MRPEIGTRALGLGGAFISNADDATGAFWNPAGLASLEAGSVVYDLSQGAVSLAYPINPIGTFGLNVLDFDFLDRFLVKHPNNPIGTFQYGSNQLLFSYARTFDKVQLGANFGYNRAPYLSSQWAPNYDVGTVVKFNRNLALGMRVRDISGVVIYDRNMRVLQTFDSQFSLGVTVTPHPILHWHSRVDATSWRFGTGLELYLKNFSARIGSSFENFPSLEPRFWGLGFSYPQSGLRFHYTYLNQFDLVYKHLLSVGFDFVGSRKSPKVSEKVSELLPEKRAISKKGSTYRAVQIAKQYGIELELLLALVYVESSFNPQAISRNGAAGLMQLMPATAQGLGLKVPNYKNKRKPTVDSRVDERFEPEKNLHAGLTYFSSLVEKYDGDYKLALGAYNVGPGRVRQGVTLPSSGARYRDKVMNRVARYMNDKSLMETDLRKLESVL